MIARTALATPHWDPRCGGRLSYRSGKASIACPFVMKARRGGVPQSAGRPCGRIEIPACEVPRKATLLSLMRPSFLLRFGCGSRIRVHRSSHAVSVVFLTSDFCFLTSWPRRSRAVGCGACAVPPVIACKKACISSVSAGVLACLDGKRRPWFRPPASGSDSPNEPPSPPMPLPGRSQSPISRLRPRDNLQSRQKGATGRAQKKLQELAALHKGATCSPGAQTLLSARPFRRQAGVSTLQVSSIPPHGETTLVVVVTPR